ncbi:MAG: Mut7-C ubiquitin/RNAse domain-containing protein [Brevinematales bacterium]|nr:Mut7-C ubiquitin/RNAse domain-containing protein [Brevinematales bacterium]
MATVTLRLYDYLALIAGMRETSLSFPLLPSVKHLAEHMGIPHTEIDLILVNGNPVTFEALPQDNDRIALYPRWHHIPIPHLQHDPPFPAFVVDVNLGRLAKFLRMLGFDTLYDNGYQDKELIDISRKEKRILLTRDKLLLCHSMVTWGHWVRSTAPYEQVREVLDHYHLYDQIHPLSRCLVCNTPLHSIEKGVVKDQLPPRVRQRHKKFFTCDKCHRLYWEGSHHTHMMAWIQNLQKDTIP